MDLFRRAEYLADDLAEEQHIRNHLLELCEPGKPVAYVYALWGHQFTQAGYFRVASIPCMFLFTATPFPKNPLVPAAKLCKRGWR